ncbi:MAG TPA: hypothetical protein VKB86_09590 [Pyrinomonadaceae bacterium]|nr:hypothetical protein [Pyrinomonadaceae bacterium]
MFSQKMRTLLGFILAVLLMNLAFTPYVLAQQKPSKEEKHIQKIRKYVSRLKRWKSDDPITAKMNDGTNIKGYIAEVADDHFVLTDRSGRNPVTVSFSQVKDVTTGFGRKTKIALGITAGILTLVVICVAGGACEK